MGDYAFHLSQSLKKLGHQILVLTQGTGTAGEEVLCWPGKWAREAWPFIRKEVQAWKPEVFHLQYMTTTFQNSVFINFLPFFLKRDFPEIKIVTTYHEFASPLRRTALIPLLWGSRAHIVTNDRHFEWLKTFKRFGVLRGKIARIPLGANILPSGDAEELRRIYRQQLGLKEEEILLTRFGILHDWSLPEVQLLARVFKKIWQEGQPVKFLVMGKAEERARSLFAGTLRELGLEKSVFVKQDISPKEINGLIAASDIGLAPYLDGVSEKRTALLSLMARGLPVISTRKGKTPSEFQENENILTVGLWDEEEWESAVRRLLTEPALRRRLSEGAKKMAAVHDWENIGNMTGALYSRLGEGSVS